MGPGVPLSKLKFGELGYTKDGLPSTSYGLIIKLFLVVASVNPNIFVNSLNSSSGEIVVVTLSCANLVLACSRFYIRYLR